MMDFASPSCNSIIIWPAKRSLLCSPVTLSTPESMRIYLKTNKNHSNKTLGHLTIVSQTKRQTKNETDESFTSHHEKKTRTTNPKRTEGGFRINSSSSMPTAPNKTTGRGCTKWKLRIKTQNWKKKKCHNKWQSSRTFLFAIPFDGFRAMRVMIPGARNPMINHPANE